MKWLAPNNIYWIAGHVFILALGIFLTIIAEQSNHRDILLGVGGSLVASGIAGEVLFLYIILSQETKDKLDLLTLTGLQRVFPTRSVSIRNEYHSRLHGAKEVDILGFGLSSFRQDYGGRFEELSSRTRFRILLLDPDFPTADASIASIRDQEEGNNQGDIRRDVEAFESIVRQAKNLNRENFQVKRLRALPSINVFRVDDDLFWGPYLIANQSRNMPTLLVRKGGFLYEEIKTHFEQLWASDQFTGPTIG
jgi:hypothetical protein